MLNLYEADTTDVATTDNSSYFRALEFKYTELARTALKKVWLRNDGVTEATGHLYVNSIEAGVGQDTWFRFAEDLGGTAGAWERQHAFTLEPGEQVPVWIKLTVPLTSTPQQRIDLRVKATYS